MLTNLCCPFIFKIFNGGDLSLRDNDGFTPFHLAAREGHLQAFKDMLKKGTASYSSLHEVLINNRFMVSVRLSSCGCKREVAKHEKSVRIERVDSRV